MFGELLEQLGTEAQRRGRAEGSLLRGLEGSGFWGGLAGDAAGPSGEEGEKCRQPGVAVAAAISCPGTGCPDKGT